ncbi:hypothetical protein EMPS_11137 [Entomortierella parvispora]|uniref:Uncharacterized protein n=1 Tax=Entomortierella parvispora TaxID=205924 RepID=A0A9P3HLM7_9FUNG|nr:hypothetical protein EMPS_11137 [Entomortierella parvispora]
MKFPSVIMMASAVALASTIYARPSLLRRVVDNTAALKCLFDTVTKLSLAPSCTSILSTDNGLLKSITLPTLTLNLEGTVPTISAANVALKGAPIPGLPAIPIGRLLIRDGPTEVGAFVTVWTDVKVAGFDLELNIDTTALTIAPDQTQAFISLLDALTTTSSHTITLRGLVDIELSLPLPKVGGVNIAGVLPSLKALQVPGVAVSADATLSCFNNLGGVVNGQLATVTMIEAGSVSFKVQIHNPGTLTVQIGDVALQVWVPGSTTEVLGIATIAKFEIVAGVSEVQIVLKANSAATLGQFFPAKAGLTLAVSAFKGSSANPIADGAIANLKFNIVF